MINIGDKYSTNKDLNTTLRLKRLLINAINESSLTINEKLNFIKQINNFNISNDANNIDHHIDHGEMVEDYLVEFVLNNNMRYKYHNKTSKHINNHIVESFFELNNISPNDVDIIIISSLVSKVESEAFAICFNIKEIIFEPNEDILLGNRIILNTSYLEYLKLPNSNIADLQKIFGLLTDNTKIYYI